MPDLLAQVTLKPVTGLAKDNVVNTFAFSFPSGAGSTEYAGIAASLTEFYNSTPPLGTASIESVLSRSISRAASAHDIDIYDITGHLDGSPHGSPVYSAAMTLLNTAAGGEPPQEMALAITLRGTAWDSMPVESPDGSDPGTEVDRLRQRRTGKVYIGPFTAGVIPAPASPYVSRPSANLRGDFLKAAQELALDISEITAGARWCVWSRTDTFLYTITHVQVDDAWDTQRRRGVAATVRDTVAITY